MKSILPGDEKGRCFLCGKYGPTEEHHIFGGPFRKKSEYYGLKAHLCHWCHNEPPNGTHQNPAVRAYLKELAQREIMQQKGWSVADFRGVFGKSWVEEDHDTM